MSRIITVKPAAGRRVVDPAEMTPLPAGGRRVAASAFWTRRIAAGDVLRVADATATAAPGAAKE